MAIGRAMPRLVVVRAIPLALSLALSAMAVAQTPASATAPVASLEPPKAPTETTVNYPTDAPAHDVPITVRVRIRVGPDGKVRKVTLDKPGLVAFDRAVVRAASDFVFSPARYGGKPVMVDIRYAHTFLPPARAPVIKTATGPPRNSILSGRLREKGTRLPVQRATVAVGVGGRRYTAISDKRGRFKVKAPAGRARVTVHGAGYLAFLQKEKLNPDEVLKVAYLVERDSYDPYEIVVFSERRRTEVSRTTLRGRELTQVPGTFGDPFRVVQTLPGVASIVALLPFPVVRGASPGSTGFLIDGVRVPLLYHLLAGPSVIHPAFLDEVSFYPGGFPVPYGGYTAGIVDGRTRRARKDEKLADVDLNLLQTGALLRHPVPGMDATATVAGRIGYPGVLISLATDDASLSYWDYQLRLDGGSHKSGYTVFAFGATDDVSARAEDEDPDDGVEPELESVLRLSFHRLDMRYEHESRKLGGLYRLVFGMDQTVLGGQLNLTTLLVEPRARWQWRLAEGLELRMGLQGVARDTSQDSSAEEASPGPDTSQFTEDLTRFYSGSAWLESLWRPTEDWLFRPGVRLDVYNDGNTTMPGFDPRLTWRYRLATPGLAAEATATARDDESTWLKGGVGIFHQPPRFFLPIPGLDTMPVRFGLLAAVQTTLGVELPLGRAFGLDAQVFYNHMDPVIFDLDFNSAVDDLQNQPPETALWELTKDDPDAVSDAQAAIDNLFAGQLGRAYGLEVLLRRKARNGVFGWLSYTLSLSEREREGAWVPFDFDRTHLLNLVAGIPLPRNWEVGARFQYQSGKPATTTYGYNTARTEGYMRVDIRVDKRAVWRNWLLDFYVDVGNVTLFPEEVSAGNIIRYVLPTVGFRARL